MNNGEGNHRTGSDDFEVPENPDATYEHPDIDEALEDIAPGYSQLKDPETQEIDFGIVDKEITEKSLEREIAEHEKLLQSTLRRSRAEKFKDPNGNTHKEVTLLEFLFDTITKKPQGHELTVLARVLIARISDPQEIYLLAEAIETTYLEELASEVSAAEEELDREFQKASDNYHPRANQIIDDLSKKYHDLKQELSIKRETSKELSLLLKKIAKIVEEHGTEI